MPGKAKGLTEAQRVFLAALSGHPKPVSPSKLTVEASPKQDIARQRCRRLGYASRVPCVVGRTYRNRWLITPAGRLALQEADNAK